MGNSNGWWLRISLPALRTARPDDRRTIGVKEALLITGRGMAHQGRVLLGAKEVMPLPQHPYLGPVPREVSSAGGRARAVEYGQQVRRRPAGQRGAGVRALLHPVT